MAEQAIRPQGAGWRRADARVASSVLLALLASACVGRREPVRPQRPVEEPKPQAVPDRPRSLVEGDEARNRVAVLVPLTGPNAGVGTSIANAANLALLDSGGTGIRITVYDTGAGGAAAAANTALAEGNRLFLGPLMAEDVSAVAPIAKAGGVPVLAFSNDTSVAGNGTYIMGFTPDQSIDRAVRHARSGGAVRFAGLVPDGIYGQRASRALIRSVESAGGRMVAMQGFNRQAASLAAAARSLNAKSGFDAVVIADSAANAGVAAPIIRGGPSRSAKLLGTELWSTDRAIGRSAALRGAVFASVPDARFDQLVARYRARYDRTPYRLASLGYDAVLLAVRINRDWPLGTPFPERLLAARDGFSGVDGAFRFDRDGTAERRLAVHEVTATGLRMVSPAPTGFDD